MDGANRYHRGEWMVDHRKHRRWIDERTALIRANGEEYLGKTEDISVGGAQLRVTDAILAEGDAVECCLVHGPRVVDLPATVVYAVPDPDQVRLGLAFTELPLPTSDFLSETYPPATEVMPDPV